MHRFFLLLLIAVFSTSLLAQVETSRFGRVSDAELEMQVYEHDSSASAVILFDIGESEILFNSAKTEFQVKYTRHVRIKILEREGTKFGDFKFALRNFRGSSEGVVRIRGYTFNKEGNRTDRHRLERNTIIEEKESDHINNVIFTMPQVREGSVIDLSYEIVSDFMFNLPQWNFQYEIPVVYSEYTIHVPEYFRYRNHFTGFERLETSKKDGHNTLAFFHRDDTPRGMLRPGESVRNERQRVSIRYKVESTTYYAQSVPALPFEDLVDNRNNYRLRMEFELLTVQFPHTIGQSFTMDWNRVVAELLASEDFGRQVGRTRYIRSDMEGLFPQSVSTEDQLTFIFNYIRNKVVWNRNYSPTTRIGARNAYQRGAGNSAEVNFNLINALQESGFEAYPVALSTRNHGRIMPHQVSITSFNHVIALVIADGKQYLLDATSNYSNPFILPINCMNGSGRIIDTEKNDWIALNTEIRSLSNTLITSKVNNNQLELNASVNYTNHLAGAFDRKLRLENGSENVETYYSNLYNEAHVQVDSFDKTSANRYRIHYSCNIQSDDAIMVTDNMMYISPLSGFEFNLQPFKAARRVLPITFDYPLEVRYSHRIEIPDGYEVADLPERVSVSFSDGDCSFVFNSTELNNEIVITGILAIRRVLFSQDEYADLQALFNTILQKQNERIVLQKL